MIGELIREFSKIDRLEETQILFGTVSGEDPFTVFVDERFTLTEDNLIFPSYLGKKNLSISGSHTGTGEIGEKIAAGDILILLATKGQYLIIGKAGEYGSTEEYAIAIGE